MSVALEVERHMEGADVIRILDAAVAERGTAADFIRSDNGLRDEFLNRESFV